MTRDALSRMDTDTRWAYHRKVRALQAAHPKLWPVYWCAYMALLGEAWASADRSLTVADAWCPMVPCTPEEATEALQAVGIVDNKGRIPAASWRDWFGPVATRMKLASDKGRLGAEKRWGKKGGNAPAMPPHMPPHNLGNTPHQPASHTSQQRQPSPARGRGASKPTPLRELVTPPPGYTPPRTDA